MIAEHITEPSSLVVFSDDWGRHPSSCQHLIKQLLPEYKVLWVNTIGTRAPRLDMATAKRVGEKLMQWTQRSAEPEADTEESPHHENLTVVNPTMWPWFSKTRDRRLNSWLLSRHLAPLIESLPQPVTAITTLPITADLPGLLPVQKWVYYCVDDFGEWPGLDGNTLRSMDIEMIRRADEIVTVSEHLQQMISAQDCPSSLLTHGVDLHHWQTEKSSNNDRLRFLDTLDGPLAVFWGVVDRRLDSAMITALSNKMKDGHILLVGPQQDADPEILNLANVVAPGPLPFAQLPQLAQAASVLIMPYADLPVTRAMQPLKMKEYMATGRPVVVSNLPAVQTWSDCMDVCGSADNFADAVLNRIQGELPDAQKAARLRLQDEGWAAKAGQLKQSLANQKREVRDLAPVM